MGVKVLHTKGAPILGDRFHLTNYSDIADPEHGRRIEYTIFDTKEGREFLLRDLGGDGLDQVSVTWQPPQADRPSSPPADDTDFSALCEAAAREVQRRLPLYLKHFQGVFAPEQIVLRDTFVSIGDATAPGKGRGFHLSLEDAGKHFSLSGWYKAWEGLEDISLRIDGRGEDTFSISLQMESTNPAVAGAAQYLEPFARLLAADINAFGAHVSAGEWIKFLGSPEFDALDGRGGGADGPSDTDWMLASVLFREKSLRKYHPTPEYAQMLMARYKGERMQGALESFLASEERAAGELGERLKEAIICIQRGIGTPLEHELFEVRVNIFGGVDFGHHRTPPGHIFSAFDKILQRYSNGLYRLRERTLSYLAETVRFKDADDTTLVFKDPGQNGGRPFELPASAIMWLSYGSFNPFGASVSVDGYLFHDVDGDGRINLSGSGDRITKKKLTTTGQLRTIELSSFDKLMKDIGTRYPPPFDTRRLETDGVPLADIRRWGETVSASHIRRKRISGNPLEDGEYRVLIYRTDGEGVNPDGWLFAAFVYLNDFDDVFIVPTTWGMEAALNEVAARNIPLTEIYIGSHGDSFLFGDITLDFDRRLEFTKDGMVIFTGCGTNLLTAQMMGAQLFEHSSGMLIFADGFNWPTPFGGIITGGEIYAAGFDHGEVTEISRHPLVNPIPGGLF